MGKYVYAKMLKVSGVGIDPTNPATYLNNLAKSGTYVPGGSNSSSNNGSSSTNSKVNTWLSQQGIEVSTLAPKQVSLMEGIYGRLGTPYKACRHSKGCDGYCYDSNNPSHLDAATFIWRSFYDRNYKVDFIRMLDKAYTEAQRIQYHGDKENSNSDSTLVSTKRCLTFGIFNKELYKKFFLTKEEIQAIKDGYIYIHDMSSRRDTMNCCIFDIEKVLHNGFEHGNLWYNEPKRLSSLAGVIGDIVLSAASQQYGGFTVPSVDEVIAPYAEKTFLEYMDEYIDIVKGTGMIDEDSMPETLAILAQYHSMLEEEHAQLNMDVCPICGSTDIIKIERMNGYLAYSRVHGDTRLNAAKMAEIKDRVSM